MGAGVAGLAAATALCSSGNSDFQVTILEASNQVGGRTRSVKMASHSVELGATTMYYNRSKPGGDPLVEYARKRGLVEKILKADYVQRSEDHKPSLQLLSSGERLPRKRVVAYKQAYFQAREQLLEQLDRDNQRETDVARTHISEYGSLNDALTEHYYSILEKGNRAVLRRRRSGNLESGTAEWGPGHVLDHMLGQEGIENGTRWSEDVDVVSYNDYQDEEHHCVLAEGYQSVAIRLAEELPSNCLLLNKEVKTIHWSPGSGGTDIEDTVDPITVVCQDGTVFAVDHVIVTVSLGVLKQKCAQSTNDSKQAPFFSPPLPTEKLAAIQKLGFGSISKVLLQFPQPLAEEHGDLELLWLERDYGFPKAHPWAMRQALFDRKNDSSIYEAWFVGPDSYRVDSTPDKEVAEGITLVAEKFLGRSLTQPIQLRREKWSSNPNFLGAYSFNATGSGKTERELLGQPVEGRTSLQLLFAGEATHPSLFSTVNGAFESGTREAHRLTRLYSSKQSRI